MLEMIRKQLQRRYQVKRDGIKTLMVEEEATNCLSHYAGDDLFEVEQGRRTYVVDLRKRTCGCRKWEMTGIPCAYAHFVITFHGHKPEDYVDHCYSIEMYKKAYAPIIYPIPSEEQWIRTYHSVLEPPRLRVTPGRPRKARTRAPDKSRDPKNPHRMRRFGLRGKCGYCKMLGHNSRTCPRKK
jgi:hypothetical protein